MKISEIMSTRVITVELDDSLRFINEIMANAKFHHLPVTNNGRLQGMISDRDILKATSPFLDTDAETRRDFEILNRKAHQIMTRDPITVPSDMPIKDAIHILLENGISCLPVISENERLVGIVTWKDLIKFFGDQLESMAESTTDPPAI
jgi:acetoin utilization protein AcuB